MGPITNMAKSAAASVGRQSLAAIKAKAKGLPPLIGIVGHAGAGKSTIANTLSEYEGSYRVSFADPIKTMCETVIQMLEPNVDWDEDGRLNKSAMVGRTGKTVREFYQTLGTEWGRDIIHQDIWVDAAKERIRRIHLDYEPGTVSVIIDDVRFHSEARMIREMGGTLIRVYRPDVDFDHMAHQSETELTEIECDHSIWNSSSMEVLVESVDAVAKALNLRKPEPKQSPHFLGPDITLGSGGWAASPGVHVTQAAIAPAAPAMAIPAMAMSQDHMQLMMKEAMRQALIEADMMKAQAVMAAEARSAEEAKLLVAGLLPLTK